MSVRLHVNVDHVATLRQARGTTYPDPVQAAALCEDAGVHGITVHLREDRRHIQDHDVERLRKVARVVVNLEMAATEEMLSIAMAIKPTLVTLVPENRAERTTEGGLDVSGSLARVQSLCRRLATAGVGVSLFIDPAEEQIRASKEAGASIIELHTGDYANATTVDARLSELARLAHGAAFGASLGLRVAAGHGLTRSNVGALLAAAPQIEELNVGHAIVADAVMMGMKEAVRAFFDAMKARSTG
ncbi:MAG: pyridoxine 5'-phosphate synthase [Sandaracinaceae bacterium]|jgi:pyridoxine 5-phosphate synthase|nr:pyridoxine 5'-phosphate synthase [Sandaracinaceae bacterium]